MMAALAASVLLAWWLGFCLASLLLQSVGPSRAATVLRLGVAVGFGFGLTSGLSFVWLVLVGQFTQGLMVAELGLAIVLTWLWWRNRRQEAPAVEATRAPAAPASSLLPWLQLAFLLVCVSALIGHVLLTLKAPLGEWDAWAAWNLHSRFLVRGGEHWACGLNPVLNWSNPDYPLLISAGVARLWFTSGETPFAPAMIASLFTFATAGVLTAAIALLRGRVQALLGGLVLLSTPFFVARGIAQCADVPVSFFMLVTLVAFALHDQSKDRPPCLLATAGVAAGLAAWTKNEGLLFIVAVVVGRAVGTLVWSKRRDGIQDWLRFAAGLIPVLAVVFWFKLAYAPANPLISEQGWQPTFERLTDLSRHIQTSMAFLVMTVKFGHGFLYATPVLAAYLLLMGVTGDRQHRSVAMSGLAILAVMGFGFYFIYIVTPFDLTWHLINSFNRLLLQLWPGFLFLFFQIAKTPSEVRCGLPIRSEKERT